MTIMTLIRFFDSVKRLHLLLPLISNKYEKECRSEKILYSFDIAKEFGIGQDNLQSPSVSLQGHQFSLETGVPGHSRQTRQDPHDENVVETLFSARKVPQVPKDQGQGRLIHTMELWMQMGAETKLQIFPLY